MAGMEINNNSDFVRSADGEKFHSNLSLPSVYTRHQLHLSSVS
jgi:hypothetical protein